MYLSTIRHLTPDFLTSCQWTTIRSMQTVNKCTELKLVKITYWIAIHSSQRQPFNKNRQIKQEYSKREIEKKKVKSDYDEF